MTSFKTKQRQERLPGTPTDEFWRAICSCLRSLKDLPVTQNHRVARPLYGRMPECLHHDFRTNTGRIAHGHGDNRLSCH